jgi:hypothetical protein
MLHQEGNGAHRARVEHNRHTILIQLSGEGGSGWTVLAVDRPQRPTARRTIEKSCRVATFAGL